MDGAPRQIEGVAVPMQHRRSRQMPKRRRCGDIRQIDRPPADLLDTGRINSCAERAGDELGAKADAESRPAGARADFEKIKFLAEKWIFVLFISADGRAEHDDETGCDGFGEIAAANIAVTEVIAGPRQRRLEGTEILEMNMPYDGRGLYRHCVSFDLRATRRFERQKTAVGAGPQRAIKQQHAGTAAKLGELQPLGTRLFERGRRDIG